MIFSLSLIIVQVHHNMPSYGFICTPCLEFATLLESVVWSLLFLENSQPLQTLFLPPSLFLVLPQLYTCMTFLMYPLSGSRVHFPTLALCASFWMTSSQLFSRSLILSSAGCNSLLNIPIKLQILFFVFIFESRSYYLYFFVCIFQPIQIF